MTEQVIPTPAPSAVRSIALLRCNAVGDFVFSLPALEAVRHAYPRATITLLGLRWHAEFLTDRPSPVDRVVVVPPAPGVSQPPGAPFTSADAARLNDFLDQMAAERFDLALQLHGGGRFSNPLVRRLGAGLTVGLRAPDAEPLDRWVPYIYFQHEVLRYLEVVGLLGIHRDRIEPRLDVTAADVAEAERVVRDLGRPIVVLHPGASDLRRRWPAERFAMLGDALAGRGGVVCITGSAQERALVDAVRCRMQQPALQLAGRLSLGGLMGLLARSALVVSNDTGPLHLAMAVGACTVGLYWCGNLINGGPLTRTRHRPLISWQLECALCGANTLAAQCEHEHSFMLGISVREAIDTAVDLLERQPPYARDAAAIMSGSS